MSFEIIVGITGVSILFMMTLAFVRHRDPFHPLMYIGAMAFFLYVFLPLYLVLTHGERIQRFFSEDELSYVQLINWLGVVCIGLGVIAGSQRVGRWHDHVTQPAALPASDRRRLIGGGVVLGVAALVGYIYQVMNVGGFFEVYGGSYGMGWAESGYVRELPLLAVGALLLLMAAQIGRRMSLGAGVLLLLCASPLLVHAVLGARRGPFFMVAVTLFAGWYFMRFRRPQLPAAVLAGLAIGLGMLFLIANRSDIHLQSDFEFERGLDSYVFAADAGNEFIYGTGAILHADALDRYWWGRRYAIVLFVRPIPRALWPSKYEDAGRFLGVPNIEINLGTGGEGFSRTLGWSGAIGAAPGIVADMWVEVWVAAFVVLFVIGWFYGRAWAAAVQRGGVWISIYCVMLALSAFLVLQTLEAMLFRFLLMAVPLWLVWRGVSGGAREPAQPLQSPPKVDRRRFVRPSSGTIVRAR